MREIVQDKGWTGSEQSMGTPLSFKDRKIIEKLSAAKKQPAVNSQLVPEQTSFAPPASEPVALR
jgi:hypothetical protein